MMDIVSEKVFQIRKKKKFAADPCGMHPFRSFQTLYFFCKFDEIQFFSNVNNGVKNRKKENCCRMIVLLMQNCFFLSFLASLATNLKCDNFPSTPGLHINHIKIWCKWYIHNTSKSTRTTYMDARRRLNSITTEKDSKGYGVFFLL